MKTREDSGGHGWASTMVWPIYDAESLKHEKVLTVIGCPYIKEFHFRFSKGDSVYSSSEPVSSFSVRPYREDIISKLYYEFTKAVLDNCFSGYGIYI
jgi:hypothetical protein